MTPAKDIAASVRQRLLNRARHEQRPFNELLQYYSMERFLYRLSKSGFADKFILKGALMLSVWGTSDLRPTMDIDLLGKTRNGEIQILEMIKEVLESDVPPDGMEFYPERTAAEPITTGAKYHGIRIRIQGSLTVARVNLQVDIGFGDEVYPAPEISVLPTVLNMPGPSLFCYSRESVIAEKMEAMVTLGQLNSRIKDFYDIWLLSRQFDFDGAVLSGAIEKTFERRSSQIPEQIDAFEEPFVSAKQVQWVVFRNRIKQNQIPESFAEVVDSLRIFLGPIGIALRKGKAFESRWTAPGPWADHLES